MLSQVEEKKEETPAPVEAKAEAKVEAKPAKDDPRQRVRSCPRMSKILCQTERHHLPHAVPLSRAGPRRELEDVPPAHGLAGGGERERDPLHAALRRAGEDDRDVRWGKQCRSILSSLQRPIRHDIWRGMRYGSQCRKTLRVVGWGSAESSVQVIIGDKCPYPRHGVTST